MKKLLVIIVMLLAATALFAGGTENKSNLSIGYLMNMSRNTETERPDAVFYNTAGTAFMKDGFYADIGNQFVFKNYEHKVTDVNNTGSPTGYGTYNAENTIILYPNAELVYKKDNFAIFGAFGVFAGGGNLEYKDGMYLSQGMLNPYRSNQAPWLNATEDDIANSVDVYSIFYGEILGGSYAFNEKISVSAAIRLIQARQSLKATLDKDPTGGWTAGVPGMLPAIKSKTLLDAEASANGVGGIFGVHYKPIDDLDIAVSYQTITKLEYEYDKAKGELAELAGFIKGRKFDRDLPAVLGLGVGYRIIEELYASVSFNYYFNKQAKNTDPAAPSEHDNSWEIAAGANYDFSDKISFSLGGLYSKQGINKTENSPVSPALDSFTIGAGTSLKFVKNLTIDIAAFKPFYFGAEYETKVGTTNIEMDLAKKSMLLLGIGATYKFF